MRVFLSFRRLIALTGLLLWSQTSNATNFIQYYQTISLAETAVVDGKYREAIGLYQDAFSNYTYNNPIDCYVAAQVAGYIRDTSLAIMFVEKGISFGLPPETITANPHIAFCLSTIQPAMLDSLRNTYRNRINKEARATAIALIQRDQSVVLDPESGSIYESDGRTLKSKYQPLWDSLLTEIIRLTTSYGFPAQKIIGTQNGDDGLFSIGPHSVFVYYIFIHHGNTWPRVGTLLRAELEKGNITPQMYAAIADYSRAESSLANMQYFALRACSDPYCKRTVRRRLHEINAARHEIGLCTYEVMEQKQVSTQAYSKWRKEIGRTPKPVFDFQQELHFMGNR